MKNMLKASIAVLAFCFGQWVSAQADVPALHRIEAELRAGSER